MSTFKLASRCCLTAETLKVVLAKQVLLSYFTWVISYLGDILSDILPEWYFKWYLTWALLNYFTWVPWAAVLVVAFARQLRRRQAGGRWTQPPGSGQFWFGRIMICRRLVGWLHLTKAPCQQGASDATIWLHSFGLGSLRSRVLHIQPTVNNKSK